MFKIDFSQTLEKVLPSWLMRDDTKFVRDISFTPVNGVSGEHTALSVIVWFNGISDSEATIYRPFCWEMLMTGRP